MRFLTILLASACLVRGDVVVPAGHQLEIEFTLVGGAASNTNGLTISGTAGSSKSGTFDIRTSIFDGSQALGPVTTTGGFATRWVLSSNNHLQPHYPLTSVATLIDGSVQGRIVMENLSSNPSNSFSFLGNVILTTAAFSSPGGFNPTAQPTITSIQVVDPSAPPTTPKVIEFERLPNSVNLTWSSESGVSYRVERSETLSGWQTLATELATGPVTAKTYPESTPTEGAAFFRIVRLP